MELEVGLRIRRTREDDGTSSVSELRIAKDRAGPVFVSRETHAMFILTSYLKGYKRDSIDIKISEDGREISISGEKPVKELLIMGRVMLKNRVEIVGFRKVFKIPNGVILDRIKAKYDEDESVLKIVMPKLVKGICGVQIEEVKKEEGFGESSQKASEIEKKESVSKDEGKDEETERPEISKEEFEAIQTRVEGMDTEEVLHTAVGVSGEDKVEWTKQREIKEPKFETKEREKDGVDNIYEGTQKKEIEMPKFEIEGKYEDSGGAEISMKGQEAIETTEDIGESEKVLTTAIRVSGEDMVEGIVQREIEEPKFETEDRDKDTVEDICEGTKEKEIEKSKFETKAKDEADVGAKISMEGLEVIETTEKGEESKKVCVSAIGASGKDMVEGVKQNEIQETKFEIEDTNKDKVEDLCEGTQRKEIKAKDEARVGAKINMEGLEAIESTKKGGESTKVLVSTIGISGEDLVEGIKQKEIVEPKFEIEDKDKHIYEGIQKKEIEMPKFEAEDKDEARLGVEISREGLKAIEATENGGESKRELVSRIGVSGEDMVEATKLREVVEPKFETHGRDKDRVKDISEGIQKKDIGTPKLETEDKDETRVGAEISTEGLVAIETTAEGGESEKVLASATGVSGEDFIERKKQEEVEEPRFETDDQAKVRVEDICDGTQVKEIEMPKFEIDDKDEESGAPKISEEGFEAIGTRVKGRDFEEVLDAAFGVSGEDMVEATKLREVVEPKFETVGRDKDRVEDIHEEIQKKEIGMPRLEKISPEGLDAIETTAEGGESEKVLASATGVSGDDIIERKKQEEVEEPRFETEDQAKVRCDGTQVKEIEMPKFEIDDKDEESEAPKTSEEGFEAIGTRVEGRDFEEVLDTAFGVSEEDMVEATKLREVVEPKFETVGRDKDRAEDIHEEIQKKEIGMPKLETEDKDERMVEAKIITEGLDAIETTAEGGESEMVLASATGVSGDDIVERKKQEEVEEPRFETEDQAKVRCDGTQVKEIEMTKFEIDDKDEESEAPKISEDGFEAIGTREEGRDFEEVLDTAFGVSGEDMVEATKLREVVEPKFETDGRDKDRAEDIHEEIQKKEIGMPKLETEDKDERMVEAKIITEGLDAIETTAEGGESEKVLASATGVSGDDIVERKKQEEVEEPRFETEDQAKVRCDGTQVKEIEMPKFEIDDKDEESEAPKISEDGFEAIGTREEGRDFEEVLDTAFGVSGEDMVEATKLREVVEPKFETDGRDKDRAEDIHEEIQKKEIGMPKLETEDKDERMVEAKIITEGLDAIETTAEGGESEKVLASATGVSGDDIVERKKQEEVEEPRFETEDQAKVRCDGTQVKEIEMPKFETEGKDEESMRVELSEDGFEAIETRVERRDSDEVLDTAIVVSGKDMVERTKQGEVEEPKSEIEDRGKDRVYEIHEGTRKKEIEMPKFEIEARDEARVGAEISLERPDAIKTTMEGGEFEKVLASVVGVSGEDILEGKKQEEIEGPWFETEDQAKVRVEDICDGTQNKRIEMPKFETEGRDEDRKGEEISKEVFDRTETRAEGRDSEEALDTAIGVSVEDMVDRTKQGEIEEPKFETEGGDKEWGDDIFQGIQMREIGMPNFEVEGKVQERVGAEIGKEGLDATETKMEGGESKKVVTAAFGDDREDIRTKRKEIEEPKFETIGGDEERMIGLSEGTQKKEIGKPKFETEGKDDERVGAEISKERLEATETIVEGGGSEILLSSAFGVSREDMVDGTKQGDIEEPKIETKDRVEDIFKGTQKKEIRKPKFDTGGKDEESVWAEISMEGLEAIETTVEGVESDKVLASAIGVGEEGTVEGTKQSEIETPMSETKDKDEGVGAENSKEGLEAIETTVDRGEREMMLATDFGVSGEDMVDGSKQGEVKEPKFETEDRDKERVEKEVTDKGFEAMETMMREFPKRASKLPLQLEESEGPVEMMDRGDDKVGEAKLKEVEEPEFQCVRDETSKLPKAECSKVAWIGGVEEAKESLAKSGSQEAEGFIEKVEREKLMKVKEEACKVLEKDYTKVAEKKGIEDSSIRPSRDGKTVQENIARKVFEVMGTVIAEVTKQMGETESKRDREVKVKGEVVIKMHSEEQEGSEKATTGGRTQLEAGQPGTAFKDGDDGGFDKDTFEVADREKTKALKEGSVETESSLEKEKKENTERVLGEAYGVFVEDNKRERTQKETEEPKAGTKYEDEQCLQLPPMQIEEPLAKMEGPKEAKVEEMKRAKRKSEEAKVVADDESTIKEKIKETETERMCKTQQPEKALQEVPEAKDPKALGKDSHKRESMLSTQQLEAKEKRKMCDDSKRTTQNIKDEELRRKEQAAESMQKTPEKVHLRKAEEFEIEAKVAYPEIRKEVEPKNEVEEPRLKELPLPKVKVESHEPLELEKKGMKWKFPYQKINVPEAREEKEEYESARPPEVKISSSTQQSMAEEKGKLEGGIIEQKSKIDFPESRASMTPFEYKEMEAWQPNLLADQNLEEKEYFKPLMEDGGQQYMLENFDEKRLETKKVAEEEKLNQKDGEERLSCKSKRTEITEREEDKKPEIMEMTLEFEDKGEKTNQIKQVAEEFKEVVTDHETEISQEELMSPQTSEIRSKEEIPKKRAVQEEKGREIPFHASGVLEAVTPKREVKPPKFTATRSKATSSELRKDEPKELPSPSIEKLIKEPCETARPGVKQEAPKVEGFPQFQEGKESIYPLEGAKASEAIANEVDKPSAQTIRVKEKGKTDQCFEGRHLEFQGPEKAESELDFQESTKRRSDQEVEKTKFSQEEVIHEVHENEDVEVEISQESEMLEDIEVEESEKKRELQAPMVIAGSAFLASLIFFFIRHRSAAKR